MPQRRVTPTNNWWKWQNVYGSQVRKMSWDNLYVNTLKHSWMMALHPIVVCYKESSKFAEKLFCFISDDLEHDTEFRFEMQRKLVQILKKSADRNWSWFFSAGCAKLQEYVKFLKTQRWFWHWRNLSFICDKPWQVTVWWHWRHSKKTNGTC